MSLQLSRNPLLSDDDMKAVDLADLESPTMLDRPRGRRGIKRELLDLRRAAKAAEAIQGLHRENELYGFTKGQFSILDLIKACVAKIGPAHFSISTWTAARKEIVELEQMYRDGQLLSVRFLIDYTFARRDKAALHHIRKTFGADSVRVANTHSKFCIFANADWQLVLRSSMNLNMNPRFEDFTLGHDPEVAAFLGGILDEIWAKQKREYLDTAKPGENLQLFINEM
jgi:hypothetical protein